jgi:hypothetical protein
MGPDGQLFINEGITDEGPLLVELKAQVITGLGLFDEHRENFSWEGDTDRVIEMLLWLLEVKDLMPAEMNEFRRSVTRLCVPGPGSYDEFKGFVVKLTDVG